MGFGYRSDFPDAPKVKLAKMTDDHLFHYRASVVHVLKRLGFAGMKELIKLIKTSAPEESLLQINSQFGFICAQSCLMRYNGESKSLIKFYQTPKRWEGKPKKP